MNKRHLAEVGVIHGFREESRGTVAKDKLCATRMHTVKAPGVAATQCIRCRGTVVRPNAVDPPVCGLSGCRRNHIAGDGCANAAVAASMNARQSPGTKIRAGFQLSRGSAVRFANSERI